jgi:hypothetical protein
MDVAGTEGIPREVFHEDEDVGHVPIRKHLFPSSFLVFAENDDIALARPLP